jgi:hypothetical protein
MQTRTKQTKGRRAPAWRPEWAAVRRIERTDNPTANDVCQATWVLRPAELKRLLRSKPNSCKREWAPYVRAMAGLTSLDAQDGQGKAALVKGSLHDSQDHEKSRAIKGQRFRSVAQPLRPVEETRSTPAIAPAGKRAGAPGWPWASRGSCPDHTMWG